MFDFKYDGSSADKIFELRNGELYAVSLDKIISKVGSLEKNDYFMQVKDFVTVDSRINGEFKRDLYNINGGLLFNGIWNIDGIMNDKLISVEYYNKNDKYNTKVYKIDDLGNQLFSNVQLIKKIVSNKKIIYFADDGIYELVEE